MSDSAVVRWWRRALGAVGWVFSVLAGAMIVFLAITGATVIFGDYWPSPPPTIRVHAKEGGCTPCWEVHVRPDDGPTAVLCAYRVKGGGFNYAGWPLSAITAVEVERNRPPKECPARWAPRDIYPGFDERTR